MAEESRGKRRKQANPKRNQVDFEKLTALGSEGEDEETHSGMEGPDSHEKSSLTASDGTEAPSPALCARGRSLSPEPWAGSSAEEERAIPQALYGQGEPPITDEEMERYDFLKRLREAPNPASPPDRLSQNGTAVIYPAAPDEDLPPRSWSPGAHGSPEVQEAVPGSPDGTRGFLACPFCQRTYRRDASLREHVKFCHERDSGNLACPLCGYSTTYRPQMERHMLMHNQAQSKHPSFEQATENRKFKCTQCGKAFKYKHHLKEHIRIHSGEKPYECANCKKRFSHSGSYSSHLSSKKCLSGGNMNGQSYGGQNVNSSPSSPTMNLLPAAGAKDTMKGLGSLYVFRPQERSLEKPHMEDLISQDSLVFARSRDMGSDTVEFPHHAFFKGTALMPYLHPHSKFEHLLQKMLQRSANSELGENFSMGGEDRGVQPGRDPSQDGNDTQESYKPRMERDKVSCQSSESEGSVSNGVTCRWCSQLFPSAAVLFQHERYLCKMNREAMEVPEGPRGKDDSPLNFSRHSPGHEGVALGPATNGYSEDRTALPRLRPLHHQHPAAMLSPTLTCPSTLSPHAFWPPHLKEGGSPANPSSPSAMEVATPPYQERGRVPPGAGSALRSPPSKKAVLSCRTPTSGGLQSEPLDLSLPKSREEPSEERNRNGRSPAIEKKEMASPPRKTPPPHHEAMYSRSSGFGHSVYSPFPLFNSILTPSLRNAGQDGLPPIPLNPAAAKTGFLSPMTYMFESDPESFLKRIQQERQAMIGEAMTRGCLDYLSFTDDGTEGDYGPGRKRLKKTEEGLYACDICDKTFQKSSSLLRHKYEHTGRRPHQCKICKKAFKHKHHLIEHSRLHSGEKPYQCDKCGKRFSHSGSYSQHMNHRYAYCRRDMDPDAMGEELQPGATPLRESSSYSEDGLDLDTAPSRAGLRLEVTPSYFADAALDLGSGSQSEELLTETSSPSLVMQNVFSSAAQRAELQQQPMPTDESSLTEDGEQGSEDSDEQQAPADNGHQTEHEVDRTNSEESDSYTSEKTLCPADDGTEEQGQEAEDTKG
ncbi:zinc finger E-box-binding homeobox 2-like isoform X1 [Lepisosteus oculatus]|uniref:zinc finger E-box-binding homeobox 2-like isoform X1 n=2 Tax=Lepisosteus oculatus TaxID=7918 RepID=UPI0035F509DA